ALHDQGGHFLLSRTGEVGNGDPSFPLRGHIRLFDGVIVIAVSTTDLSAVVGDSLLAPFADTAVQEDDATAAELLGPGSDRAAMISICRTANGQLGCNLTALLTEHFGRIYLAPQPFLKEAVDQTGDSVCSAQRLEAG